MGARDVHVILEDLGNSCKRQVSVTRSNRPIPRFCRLRRNEKKKSAVAGRENVSRESEAVELCRRVTTSRNSPVALRYGRSA
ncbi:hypothetical protein K0M31_000578, partial [Melipona bicolor]